MGSSLCTENSGSLQRHACSELSLYRIAQCSLVDLVPMTPALDTPSPATLSTGCCASLLKARISRTCACSGRIRRSREESSFQHGRQRQQKGRGTEDAVPFLQNTKKTACNPTQTFTMACNYRDQFLSLRENSVSSMSVKLYLVNIK